MKNKKNVEIPVYLAGDNSLNPLDTIKIKKREWNWSIMSSVARYAIMDYISRVDWNAETHYFSFAFDAQYRPICVFVNTNTDSDFYNEPVFERKDLNNVEGAYIVRAQYQPALFPTFPSINKVKNFIEARNIFGEKLVEELVFGHDMDESEIVFSFREHGYFEAENLIEYHYYQAIIHNQEEIRDLKYSLCDMNYKLNKIVEKLGISED